LPLLRVLLEFKKIEYVYVFTLFCSGFKQCFDAVGWETGRASSL